MKELAEAFDDYVDAHAATGATVSNHALQQAANKWATHALETYKGDLLRRAVEISVAISEFITEMEP